MSVTSIVSADGIWPVCGRVSYNGRSVMGARIVASCEGRQSNYQATGLLGFYSTTVTYKSSPRVTITAISNQYGTFQRTVEMDGDKTLPAFTNQLSYFLFVLFNFRVDLNERHLV